MEVLQQLLRCPYDVSFACRCKSPDTQITKRIGNFVSSFLVSACCREIPGVRIGVSQGPGVQTWTSAADAPADGKKRFSGNRQEAQLTNSESLHLAKHRFQEPPPFHHAGR